MKRLGVLILTLVLLAVPHTATATRILLQQGAPDPFGSGDYAGVEDTTIYNYDTWNPDTGWQMTDKDASYGSSGNMKAGWCYVPLPDTYIYGQGVGLLKFDLSALAGQSIQSARLYIYLRIPNRWADDPTYIPWQAGVIPTPQEDADWVAGASDGLPQVGASCFSQKRYAQENWQSFSPELIAPGLPSGSVVCTYTSRQWRSGSGLDLLVYRRVYFDLQPSLVSTWANAPQSNGGLLLYGDEQMVLAGGVNSVASSDNAEQTIRPMLDITFTPEPSSLLSLGGAFLSIVFVVGRRRA